MYELRFSQFVCKGKNNYDPSKINPIYFGNWRSNCELLIIFKIIWQLPDLQILKSVRQFL
jgi:hypothetical protein